MTRIKVPTLTQTQYEHVYARLPDPETYKLSNTIEIALTDGTKVKCVLVRTKDGRSWLWKILADFAPDRP